MKQSIQHIVFFSLLLPVAFPLSAQQPAAQEKLEAIVESIVENLGEDAEATQVTQDLEYFAENPLNINDATEMELERLHLLNPVQIQKLLQYIKDFGPAYSIFELNTVDGIDPELLQKMEPFIWFGLAEEAPKTLSNALKYARHQLLLRNQTLLQKQNGYKKRENGTLPFEGNRSRYYSRYHFRADEKITAGITAEKDPGEAFFSRSNTTGFDFYSGHLSLQLNPVIQKVIVGDYVVRSGQGLVLWQGFSTSKSVYSMDISKAGQGLRPFTSTDENQFFRGVAVTLEFGDGTFELFYSGKKRDGNLEFSEETGHFFTSLQTSGYHRTQNEIDDERSIRDRNIGGNFHYNFGNLRLGATAVHQQFDKPFIRRDQLYNIFRFQGSENFTTGADYLFSKGKYQLFGEAAISKSKGKAFLQGAIAHLHNRINFSALIRHFDKNYHALWANPFSEGSSAGNETGIYFGTRILPVKFVTLSAYSDFYRSEWLNFTTAGPASGRDIFAQADFVFSETFQFYIRHKNEEKDQKFKLEKHYANLPEKTIKTRLHFQYHSSPAVLLRTRLEHAGYKGTENENGFMIYQDVKFSPVNMPLTASYRLTWFNTDSYNARIYAYENDLLYTFSIPAYFGKGWRNYINLRYKISNKINLWFKLGHTVWTDRETISSGYSKIDGNQKTEVKLQLRLKI
ncbi:MAG: ComEA family DNA-binding protein [Prolixibacteraceae bacterium]